MSEADALNPAVGMWGKIKYAFEESPTKLMAEQAKELQAATRLTVMVIGDIDGTDLTYTLQIRLGLGKAIDVAVLTHGLDTYPCSVRRADLADKFASRCKDLAQFKVELGKILSDPGTQSLVSQLITLKAIQ